MGLNAWHTWMNYRRRAISLLLFSKYMIQILRYLNIIAPPHSYPAIIRKKPCQKFTNCALDQLAFEHEVELWIIESGKPTQAGSLINWTVFFAMHFWMINFWGVLTIQGKKLVPCSKKIMNADHIRHFIIRRHQSFQPAGAMGNHAVTGKLLITTVKWKEFNSSITPWLSDHYTYVKIISSVLLSIIIFSRYSQFPIISPNTSSTSCAGIFRPIHNVRLKFINRWTSSGIALLTSSVKQSNETVISAYIYSCSYQPLPTRKDIS